MRATGLWQPWGSLWLSGVKIHETRHWPIQKQWKDWKPGDRIAVLATVRFIKSHDSDLAGILRGKFGMDWYKTLPTGALIGTIGVASCERTEHVYTPNLRREDMSQKGWANFICGDFTPGRYAWKGVDPIIFPTPIPYKGSQGIFSVSDDILPAHR